MADGTGLPLPEGMTPNDFGEAVGWGSGHEAARARRETITRSELQAIGVTPGMARAWRDFYRGVARDDPENPSAEGRADLMAHVVELLEGEA